MINDKAQGMRIFTKIHCRDKDFDYGKILVGFQKIDNCFQLFWMPLKQHHCFNNEEITLVAIFVTKNGTDGKTITVR